MDHPKEVKAAKDGLRLKYLDEKVAEKGSQRRKDLQKIYERERPLGLVLSLGSNDVSVLSQTPQWYSMVLSHVIATYRNISECYNPCRQPWPFSQGKRRKTKMMAAAKTANDSVPDSMDQPSNLPLADDVMCVAKWDPYGFEAHDVVVKAAASPLSMEAVKSQLPPPKVPVVDASGKLCAACLYKSLSEQREPTDIQKALDESARKYLEVGYLELEKLTHETYALSFSPCDW